MSSLHDESDRRAATPGAEVPRRVLSDPHGVTFSAPGWSYPIAYCTSVRVEPIVQGDLVWDRYDIDALRLSMTSALLAIQGLPLRDFFPPDGRFCWGEEEPERGPFVFLRGDLVLALPPPCLLRVVLARIVRVPEGNSSEQILTLLLQNVLSGEFPLWKSSGDH